jgi:hypothetical protein
MCLFTSLPPACHFAVRCIVSLYVACIPCSLDRFTVRCPASLSVARFSLSVVQPHCVPQHISSPRLFLFHSLPLHCMWPGFTVRRTASLCVASLHRALRRFVTRCVASQCIAPLHRPWLHIEPHTISPAARFIVPQETALCCGAASCTQNSALPSIAVQHSATNGLWHCRV